MFDQPPFVKACGQTVLWPLIDSSCQLREKSRRKQCKISFSTAGQHPTLQWDYLRLNLILMNQWLKFKLPRVTFSSVRFSEAHWQELLPERNANVKLRQKEYVVTRRSVWYSDIGEGDHSLLNKSCKNKSSPNLEIVPYKVIQKKKCCPYRRSRRQHQDEECQPDFCLKTSDERKRLSH